MAREERGRGHPRTDVERVMSHYNIDRATAEYWLTIHPIDELLPERGTGLETGRARGVAQSSGSSDGKIALGVLLIAAGLTAILTHIKKVRQ